MRSIVPGCPVFEVSTSTAFEVPPLDFEASDGAPAGGGVRVEPFGRFFLRRLPLGLCCGSSPPSLCQVSHWCLSP